MTFLFLFFLAFSSFSKTLGLPEGSTAPNFKVKTISGQSFDLKKELKKGPVVLVFYRGGWCPYCNLQLRNLQAQVVPKLKEFKAQMAAISVDKLDEALKTQKTESLGMTLISDPSTRLLKKFNVLFKVPEDLVKKYKEKYYIDLEKSSGKKHHTIAIPAVYTINKEGKIVFAYANENYKVRAQIKDIMNSLKKAQ